MNRRTSVLVACCSFLAGIGATAVAAWFQLRWEDRAVEASLAAEKAVRERAEGEVTAAREEARQGRHHVESLLRTPTVSSSDRLTDITAAKNWLRKMKEVD